MGKYRNYGRDQIWRRITKTLNLIYFSVECCEIVVAINYQQSDSMLPSKAVLQPAIFQAARKNGGGRAENFPPALSNIIDENYIFLGHFFISVCQHFKGKSIFH